MKYDLGQPVVCIIGLVYVGLLLAQAFSRNFKVIGFDIDSGKVKELKQNQDTQKLFLTDNPAEITKADFIIICVPTPVTKSKEPDLSFIKSAAEIVSRNIKKGNTVILESTVYPGATEEIVKPILEESGKQCGLKPLLTGYNRHHLLVSLAYTRNSEIRLLTQRWRITKGEKR